MSAPLYPKLDGTSIILTGANRGLGRALALALGQAGARLVLHARDPAALDPVCAALASQQVAVVSGDLRDRSLAGRLAQAAVERFGRIDVLILNAAMLGPMAPLLEIPADAFDEVMAVNVSAQLGLAQAALPTMLEQRMGLMVWLSSGLGRFGLPRYGAYCASKHAVEGLMKSVTADYEARGLTSVAVAPGMVQTEMLRVALDGADISGYQTPEATADACVRMLTQLTPTHNGQSLDIAPWLA